MLKLGPCSEHSEGRDAFPNAVLPRKSSAAETADGARKRRGQRPLMVLYSSRKRKPVPQVPSIKSARVGELLSRSGLLRSGRQEDAFCMRTFCGPEFCSLIRQDRSGTARSFKLLACRAQGHPVSVVRLQMYALLRHASFFSPTITVHRSLQESRQGPASGSGFIATRCRRPCLPSKPSLH